MEYLPSAFQIRYGGCKGMVAYDPTLDKSKKIIQVSKVAYCGEEVLNFEMS